MGAVGAYTAERAAALSGVPKSTIHGWARNDVLVPSVSARKVMLWSYADLMGLRGIYWLRQRKVTKLGVARLETRALSALARDGVDVAGIHGLYPYVSTEQIDQALDLERQLDERAA